ncbi:MAG: transglycosylase domain-containing protein [Treponema sp.]|nr:transglycosylase domain-containing protein [Treponema sp.]
MMFWSKKSALYSRSASAITKKCPGQKKSLFAAFSGRPFFAVVYGLVITAVLVRIFFAVLPYPELKFFEQRNVSTRVYDRNGRLLQIMPLENGLRREFVTYKQIPRDVRKIFVRSEDRRFYLHPGIDAVAVLRAAVQNWLSGKNISGASTITMQLARMVSPSGKRTLMAKFRDSINALRIESKLSKRRIFELYLNNVPFGKNTEGVASAARRFFSKNLNELTKEEICCLAVILRSPATYDPLINPENCASAAARLQVPGISPNALLSAASAARSFVYPDFFPHYINFLKNKFPEKFLRQNEVHLCCDLETQCFSEAALKRALEVAESSRIKNGAVFVIDVHSGEILSWIGSNNWYDRNNGGQIDGVLNKFQPGSSMKPFLYALAMETESESGKPILSPNSVLADIPREFGSQNIYIPQNFNNRYNGPVLARTALSSSLNIPAVTLLEKVGVQKYIKKLSECGFEYLDNGWDYGFSLALGSAEVSLFSLVPAFSVFVRDGKLISLEYFNNAESKEAKQVFKSDTARIIASFLSDKKARALGFGYSQTFETLYPSIFKTGTANQFQNIVALGATKEFAVGVWMGNFNGNTVVGKTGSSLPAQTARQILDFLQSKTGTPFSQLEFPRPKEYSLQKVCALSGKIPNAFCQETVYEYVKNDFADGSALEECDWHVPGKDNVCFKIKYPAEYQQWLSLWGNEDSSYIDYDSAPVKILSPQDNSVYYIDYSKRTLNQIVPFEVTGGSADIIEVYDNGVLVLKKSKPFLFSLPAVQGIHSVTIKNGKEIAGVRFTVK